MLYRENWPIPKGPITTVCISVGSLMLCIQFRNAGKRNKTMKKLIPSQGDQEQWCGHRLCFLFALQTLSFQLSNVIDFSFHVPPLREWKSNLIRKGLFSNCWVQSLCLGLEVLGEQDNKFSHHKAFISVWESNS